MLSRSKPMPVKSAGRTLASTEEDWLTEAWAGRENTAATAARGTAAMTPMSVFFTLTVTGFPGGLFPRSGRLPVVKTGQQVHLKFSPDVKGTISAVERGRVRVTW